MPEIAVFTATSAAHGKSSTWTQCALALLTLFLAAPASAGPPFLTDDPEPVDRSHVEFNLTYQAVHTVSDRAGSFSGEVNYGCAPELQCHVALPVAFDHPAGGPGQTGIGDAELGLKYRFLDQPDDGWSAAVYPTVDLPTGDAGRGLGNGRAELLLPLWVQRTVGDWRWDAGASYLLNNAPGSRGSWYTGLLAQYSFGDRLSLGAEMFHRGSSVDGQTATFGFTLGAIVNLAAHQNLLVSAGRALRNLDTHQRSVFLAYQLEH